MARRLCVAAGFSALVWGSPGCRPATTSATAHVDGSLSASSIGTDECSRPDPRAGSEALAFSLPMNDGGRAEFPQDGAVTIVAFWASWCEPCSAELPTYEALVRRLDSPELGLLLVSLDDDPDLVTRALETFGVKRRSAYGGESVFGRYLVESVPLTIVVDAHNRIRSVHRGFDPRCTDELELELRTLLSGREP